MFSTDFYGFQQKNLYTDLLGDDKPAPRHLKKQPKKKTKQKQKPSSKQKPSVKVQGNSSEKMQEENPSEKIVAMIQKKEWLNAIQAATEYLAESKNINYAEMLQHRAYALMKFGKYHDAINDISKAIEIEKTDMRLKMRAAMWLTIGERDLCNLDLMKLSNKEGIDGIESV